MIKYIYTLYYICVNRRPISMYNLIEKRPD